jgi:hypothetical protein
LEFAVGVTHRAVQLGAVQLGATQGQEGVEAGFVEAGLLLGAPLPKRLEVMLSPTPGEAVAGEAVGVGVIDGVEADEGVGVGGVDGA